MTYAESFNQEHYCGTPQTYSYQADIEISTPDDKLDEIKEKLTANLFEFTVYDVSKVDELNIYKISLSVNHIDFDLHMMFPDCQVDVEREEEVWE